MLLVERQTVNVDERRGSFKIASMVKENETNHVQANATYTAWLLQAIAKIKQQKQRPNEERICNAIQANHKVTRDAILEQLSLAVKDGSILAVQNKGITSYKDPSSLCQLQTRSLEVTPQTDLTKVVIRSVRELGEKGGSTIRSIEKYIKSSYRITFLDGANLNHLLKVQIKRIVKNGHLKQEGAHLKLGTSSTSDTSNGVSASKSVKVNEDIDLNDIILPFERHRVSFIFIIMKEKTFIVVSCMWHVSHFVIFICFYSITFQFKF